MARGRTTIISSDDLESSPDPLNASITGNAIKPRRRVARTSQAPLRTSSPSKSNRRPSVSDGAMELSSPSKVMVMNTPRSGGASPWRIKVTVQAEPGAGSDIENESSPIVQRMTRTTTTTIPLKDDDASSPVKRRGRPRKSDATPGAKTKRSGTPVRKRAQSKGRKSNVGVSDASTTDPPVDAPPKKRRGRPKKNPEPEPVNQPQSLVDDESQLATDITTVGVTPTPEPEPQEAATASPIIQSTVATPAGPSTQLSVPRIQTTEATPQEPLAPNNLLQGNSLLPSREQTKGRRRALPEYEEPIMFGTPPETELSKRLKARKRTPHAKFVAPHHDSSEEDNTVDTPSGTDEEAQVHETHAETIPFNEYVQIPHDEATPVEEVDGHQDATIYAFDEGITRMPDDTTIIDSENFSMISVDSLPSSGAFTSPAAEQLLSPPFNQHVPSVEPLLNQSYLNIPSTNGRSTRNGPHQASRSSPIPQQAITATSKAKSSPAPQHRHKTPVMDMRSPSNPPAIETAKVSPTEAQTPRIGRVVKAGVALQGVLDPERLTPAESSKQMADERLARLDDLFRGFSEGTRKELQAGLRLGEQLARQKHDQKTNGQAGSPMSSAIKQSTSRTQATDVFLSPTIQPTSRLLTPEDQDEYTLPVPPPQMKEVQYPSLPQDEQVSQLVSPARSEDEMSWRVDTPPVTLGANGVRSFITTVNERAHDIHGGEISVLAATEEQEKESYEDIWQEEASRSSVDEEPLSQAQASKTPPLEDLFSGEPLKPARGKLPRTWRRTSGSDFQYSDEAEESPQGPTSSSTEESSQPISHRSEKNKGKFSEPIILEETYNEEDDIGSEASDDTGMFFQSNLPNLFNKGRTVERRRRRPEGLEYSRQFDDGQSLLPESSPARPAPQNITQGTEQTPGSAATKSSPPNCGTAVKETGKLEYSTVLDDGKSALSEPSPVPRARSQKPHPFRATPPRITAIQSSPAKSSPLRQEIHASSSPSFQQSALQEESTLPLHQSSPFHTNVDITLAVTASDEYQFRQEMEGRTDSSIRVIREEADAHLNAYETQYRTLNDVTELTEPSQSMRSTILMPSSPPKNTSFFKGRRERPERSLFLDDGHSVLPECSQVLDDSILKPRREYSPLFGEEVAASSHMKAQRPARQSTQKPVVTRASPTEEPPKVAPAGVFSRLTTAIWGTLATPTPAVVAPLVLEREEEAESESESEPESLPHHPATARFNSLPRAEPWTKTHYKTLDALYQLHKKQPTTFALSRSTNSETNYTLLEHFLEDEKKPFIGATYSSWGYSVDMSESLVVLCAAYMQLLNLESIEEYERVSGKEIQVGDCNPGTAGEMITGNEVMRRLASVVMGEVLRRDEKKGLHIDRSGGMTITWPAEFESFEPRV